SPRDLSYAQPCLSTWARNCGGRTGSSQNDPSDPTDTPQLRASTNSRAKNVRLATWHIFGRVSIPTIGVTYKRRSRAVWYATECLGAPTLDSITVLRKRRPHPTVVQVGVISALIFSRNRYASGYLAPLLAVWLFGCKAHVDEKHIFSRFRFTVHDSTARTSLDSLTCMARGMWGKGGDVETRNAEVTARKRAPRESGEAV
ncbi:hypothetical protein DFH09DRAFT_965878, partial [Mycena vulgaris]